LPARDERANDGERDHQQPLSDPAERQLVRKRGQRGARSDEQRRHAAEQESEP
jgi:hypothetical protein